MLVYFLRVVTVALHQLGITRASRCTETRRLSRYRVLSPCFQKEKPFAPLPVLVRQFSSAIFQKFRLARQKTIFQTIAEARKSLKTKVTRIKISFCVRSSLVQLSCWICYATDPPKRQRCSWWSNMGDRGCTFSMHLCYRVRGNNRNVGNRTEASRFSHHSSTYPFLAGVAGRNRQMKERKRKRDIDRDRERCTRSKGITERTRELDSRGLYLGLSKSTTAPPWCHETLLGGVLCTLTVHVRLIVLPFFT